jgi:nitroimidazol reductase NimA-like FMN-containing flavoprotein (pyridoxamine 5'-phosphate oxidase superfamily)
VLSTVTEEGRPYSVGINYGVSLPGTPFGIYLMTRRHFKKARNIVENPMCRLSFADEAAAVVLASSIHTFPGKSRDIGLEG